MIEGNILKGKKKNIFGPTEMLIQTVLLDLITSKFSLLI